MCVDEDLPQLAQGPVRNARARIPAPDYQATDAARAGSAGTLLQAVRRSGLRQACYVGLAKTHLQSLLRILNWLLGAPVVRTRGSRFRQLLTPSRLWAEGMRKRYREVRAPRTIYG